MILCQIVFLLFLMLFMGACSEIFVSGSEGIPDQTYQGIPPVLVHDHTVGNLTEGYIKNTESLITVNGRLLTLCEAHDIKNCTGPI